MYLIFDTGPSGVTGGHHKEHVSLEFYKILHSTMAPIANTLVKTVDLQQYKTAVDLDCMYTS